MHTETRTKTVKHTDSHTYTNTHTHTHTHTHPHTHPHTHTHTHTPTHTHMCACTHTSIAVKTPELYAAVYSGKDMPEVIGSESRAQALTTLQPMYVI